MYHAIVIDDEPLLRMNIVKELSQPGNDCIIIAEASNGLEAIEKIRQYRPELVLTDIVMPVMNGVDLIHQIHNEGFNCKIIVLSNHDDFSFVRETLLLGASDYLLKSEINQQSLSSLVKRVLQEQSELDRAQNKQGRVDRQRLITELLAGKIGLESPYFEELGLSRNDRFRGVIFLSINNFIRMTAEYTEDEKRVLISGMDAALRQLDAGSFWQYMGEGGFAALFGLSESVEMFFSQKEAWFGQIRLWVERCMNAEISAGISTCPIKGGFSFSELRLQGFLALEERFYSGPNRLYRYVDLPAFGTEDELNRQFAEIVYLITVKLSNSRMDGLEQFVLNIWARLRSRHFFPRDVRVTAANLLYFISRLLAEEELEQDPDYHYEAILNYTRLCESWDELSLFIAASLAHTVEASRIHRRKVQCRNLQRAFEYIELHYYETDLTLQKIAAAISVNPSYLSRLFYQKAEETYTNYITKVRIERAKQLLCGSSASIEEISEQVGYTSAKYFYKVFKDECGVAPTQYRKFGNN
jgi:two-component system response regulator YesN